MKHLAALLILFSSHFVIAQNQNPILLIPGVGGSILKTDGGNIVWISIARFLESYPNLRDWGRSFSDYTDDAFRLYMLGVYDGKGGLSPVFTNETLNTPYRLDRSDCEFNLTPGGLCGIEYLVDVPETWWDSYFSEIIEWLMQNKSVDYFGELISFLKQQGYQTGTSLFGF